MRKVLWFFLLFIPLGSYAQEYLKDIRKKSWQTIVYLIPARDAIEYQKKNNIPINDFLNKAIYQTYPSESLFEDKLPPGHYVFISAIENDVSVRLFNKSNLMVLAVNNKHQLQLDIRTRDGKAVKASSVFVNNVKATLDTYAQTFWVKKKSFEDATVVVCSPGDTLITFVSTLDELDTPVHLQKKSNYRNSSIYKILNWGPKKFNSLFGRKREKIKVDATGFIIFNQPKYKPLDTLKFKGYVVNKKWKEYNKNVKVFMEYYSKGKHYSQFIKNLQPVSAASYVHEFVLADSLPTDINYSLIFKTVSGKHIIRESFRIEDYVLDEIGTQQFRSEKETYFRNDSLRFFAGAKDANGLYVMDATARLILTTARIEKYYQDSMFVADTLYNKDVKLKTDGDTKFVVSTTNFPQADLSIEAKLVFKNANNELQEKTTSISYLYQSKKIFVKQVGDSLKAIYIENGNEKRATGEMEMNDEEAIKISYPFVVKIDPIAEDYYFYYEDATDTLQENINIGNNYEVSISRISQGDTLGFVLENPYKIPVYFTVFYGKQIIATGKNSDQNIVWKKYMNDRRKMYKVKWQYYWAGEEKSKEETIGLLYKLLNIKIENSDSVFPGQKDSIKINVTDYLGQPAAAVNLTAVSYNNQFKNNIRVKDPPYLVKYKSKKYIERDGFETDEPDETIFTKKYLLGNHIQWKSRLGLDTMEYYKLLFPPGNYYDAVRPLNNITPQISVNVVSNGVPQEIYLLYINRQLAYYNGVTDRMNYAYEVYPENVQLGIRLKNKFIQIDSLYMQPFYKHDLSFDLNNLPKFATIKVIDTVWSATEKLLLEKTMWKMQNNPDNNFAYLWQGRSVLQLSGNREHIAGPFVENERMYFFRPGVFDINFLFEPGYQYKMSGKVIRLEKIALFPKPNIISPLPAKKGQLLLGDTLVTIPEISYPVVKPIPELKLFKQDYIYYSDYHFTTKGKILFTLPKDSTIKYIILQQADSIPIILNGYHRNLFNLSPGNYQLVLVTSSLGAFTSNKFEVRAGGTICLKLDTLNYNKYPLLVEKLFEKAQEIRYEKQIVDSTLLRQQPAPKKYTIPDSLLFVANGGGTISGTVKDIKGNNAIPNCTAMIKDAATGVVTDVNGFFELSKVRPGKYILLVSVIGYVSKEIAVEVLQNGIITLNVLLEIDNSRLEEVVVVGYGMVTRRSMTGSVSRILGKELTDYYSLAGKIAGVNVSGATGVPGSGTMIKLRGANSISGDNGPIYVVDGIVYTSPPNIDPDFILDVTVLKDAEAIELFGSLAANGAIVITTKIKTDRKDFRDYAFWVPNFFTDKNGKAAIEVNYPDNVTGWKTFVVAMDKKRRIGKTSVITQAYKPMLAQLNLPLFLLEGDSSFFVTKAINYTADKYAVKTAFTVNGTIQNATGIELLPNDAAIDEVLVMVNSIDTLTASFGIKSTTGFKDMEQRKIPVFKKGVEQATGNFWVLDKDTTVFFQSKAGMKSINLYAHNNTLDLMLEELEQLKRYPYYCMEQVCSKLTGLVLEKKIREKLKQSFKAQKELDGLLKKIQKAQQFDGGWAWWENGKSNVYITNYVVNALLEHRENPLVEANIRNAFLYLNNRLSYLNKGELLASLTTLSNGKHEMNYAQWLGKIKFDSISQHEQWQWVKIKQQQKLDYKSALDSLIKKKTATMLGGLHWGAQNYKWYSNDIATTILAFDVLQKEEKHHQMLPSIIQYFLEKRQNGYWTNTVETAGILNTILPKLLADQENFQSPASLSISGDTSFNITSFPYQAKITNPSFKNLTISKRGGGLVYFTAYQQFFNRDPKPVTDNFIVETFFKQNGQSVAQIKTGERTKMIIKVDVLKDAEYVMLTVPIPAGCIFTNKTNNDWKVFKEYRKDKLFLFTETLNKGIHWFEVELEPRYNGIYTLNPSTAALMYYPTFYGRNETKKILLTH